MGRSGEDPLLNFIEVLCVDFEGIFNLASIDMDFVGHYELLGDFELLGLLHFLLTFVWIKRVLVGEDKLELLTHFLLQDLHLDSQLLL